MNLIKSCGVLLLLSTSVLSAKFPANVEKCNAGDHNCIQRVSQDVLKSSANGNPGLGLPSIDPLKIDKINIQEGSGGPVNINLSFSNVTMSGLSNLQVYFMSGFDGNVTSPKAMKARLPSGITLTLEGDYTMNGKVLLLPINGRGKSKLDFHGWDSDWKIKTKLVEKNGKQHVAIEESKLAFKASGLTMNFETLFSDKQLSDTMNVFLNENWEVILNELRPSLSETISQIIVSLVSGTFARIPYKDLFAE